MLRSLFSAVSGMQAHQTKLDVIGNNIANVNTCLLYTSIVTEASPEVKKLEKMTEKQLAEYRHDEAKEQQDLIIEHVAGAFVRNGVS